MTTIVLTGFPGFLGSALLPRILARDDGLRAVCIVQPRYLDVARRRADVLTARAPNLGGRIVLAEGDIREPGLGLADPGALHADAVEVYHLAAIYDVSVSREPAERVNVDGTRNVLDFAAACDGLRRVHHVSTCYVSGRHPGVFTEDDLDVGQRFNNHYEETKYRAEVEVRERISRGMPATIYRPAIVVGDSRTGATRKYDGPYFFIRLILRQGRVAFLPVVGDPDRTPVNLVPRDYVIDAMTRLAGMERSLGRVYHLADPDPLTIGQVLDELSRASGKRVIRVPLPAPVARGALRRVPGVRSLLGVPPEAVDYFTHPTTYTNRNAVRDLRGTGIVVPSFPAYADRLVDFVRENPEVGAGAMA